MTHTDLAVRPDPRWNLDRKSTRLNSSHLVISYAVFCLKKKKDIKVRLLTGALCGRQTPNRNRHSHEDTGIVGHRVILEPTPDALGHFVFFFFFNDTATTEIYTLSLHDALPIYIGGWPRYRDSRGWCRNTWRRRLLERYIAFGCGLPSCAVAYRRSCVDVMVSCEGPL